jgi:serine/threonine protein kinase
VAELGRGTFGKVYLARQGDLADRPVALKVAVDLHGESQALAQLQHTNIVPSYSMHRAGPFHAVCMPYLGRTTLAYLRMALRRGFGLKRLGEDRDLEPLADHKEFQKLRAAAALLATGDRP